MAKNTYSCYGSQIVVDCENPSHNKCFMVNSDSIVGQLKAHVRYFTLNAAPQRSKKDQYEDLSHNIDLNENSENGNDPSVIPDEKPLVSDNSSCESFYSCKSSANEQVEFNDSSEDYEEITFKKESAYKKKNKQSCDDEFFKQITLINAIFLSKDTEQQCKESDYSYQFSSPSKTCVFKISRLPVDKETLSSTIDHNSENNVFKNKNNNVENTALKCQNLKNKNNGIKKVNIIGWCRKKTTLPLKKGNERINKTTVMSKIFHSKKSHRMTLCNLRTRQKTVVKYPQSEVTETLTNNMLQISDELGEIYNSKYLLMKHMQSESSEMCFLEPFQRICCSILEPNVNSETDLACSENETKEVDIPVNNIYDDLDESLKLLFKESYHKNTIDNVLDKLSSDESDTNCAETPNSLSVECSPDLRDVSPTVHESVAVADLILTKTIHPELPEIGFISNENYCNDRNINNSDIGSKDASEYSEEIDKKIINKDGKDSILKINEINNLLRDSKMRHKKLRLSSCRSVLPSIEEYPEPPSDVPVAAEDNYCLVDTEGRPIHLYDSKGLPLTDGNGRPLRSVDGELLMKCDTNGIPIVDEDSQIYDMFGRQPHQEDFQPWLFPEMSKAKRLTMVDGCPMLVFDMEGRPLTTVSGTMLVDSYGRSLFTLNSFVQPNV